MTFKDFRIGWRTLVQEPAYSLVVILGLAVGVTSALLLLGLVRYSWQYNAHVPDAGQVYIVKHRNNTEIKAPWFDESPLLLRNAAASLPGVVDATAFIPMRPHMAPLAVNIDGRLKQLDGLMVLPGFIKTMGVQAIAGDLAATLDKPEGIAITEYTARRLFGKADVLGLTMKAEGKLMRVGAVLRNPPANTTIEFQALVGINSVTGDQMVHDEMLSGAMGWLGKVLVRIHPDASVQNVADSLQRAADVAPAIQKIAPDLRAKLGTRRVVDVVLSPLRHAYFDNEVTGSFNAGIGKRGNPTVVAGLAVMAVLILALAAINYVNLASVRVLRRQREVAMRKVLGAGVRRIVLQLLAESMLVAMLATTIGLVLAWLALPLFSELVDRKLDSVLSPANIGAALALGALLGVLTALYPAWIASGVRPGAVLAGRADTETASGMGLRRVMTVLQVATAMVFAGVTTAVAWQTDFALRASPGFDPAPLLIVDLPEPVKYSEKGRAFLAAVQGQPGVAGVAISEDAVGRKNVMTLRSLKRPGGGALPMDLKQVSVNFFEQYRIEPAMGRLFRSDADKDDDAEPIVLNAVAARSLGFASPAEALGQPLLVINYDGKLIPKRVIGIAPELRFTSLREAPHAVAYELGTGGAALSVRAQGSPVQVEPLVQALWPRYFPETLLRTVRASDVLAANYADDARMVKLLVIATGIALAIAAFGTYVLSAHTVQRRGREIVMRKLYGAGRSDIGLLVVREISALALIAAVIGLPLAAVAIQRYLAPYVERAPIGYWTLAFALGSTLLVALAAVARHAWIASRMRPADVLRG